MTPLELFILACGAVSGIFAGLFLAPVLALITLSVFACLLLIVFGPLVFLAIKVSDRWL